MYQIGEIMPELLLRCFSVVWFKRTANGSSQISCAVRKPLSVALPVFPLEFKVQLVFPGLKGKLLLSLLVPPPLLTLRLLVGHHSEMAKPFSPYPSLIALILLLYAVFSFS